MVRGSGGPNQQASAGILLYRIAGHLEMLIAHPGGPFWAHRDDGSWSIPKGLLRPGEEALAAAHREFREETGVMVPEGAPLSLGSIVQRSGKTVHAWATEGDADPSAMVSNTFTLEWPRGSGRNAEFPEMDRFLWANPAMARRKLNKPQATFVSRLERRLTQSKQMPT